MASERGLVVAVYDGSQGSDARYASRCARRGSGKHAAYYYALYEFMVPMMRGCPSTIGVACSSKLDPWVKAARLASALLENCQ